jgi:hypothetical protein
MRNKTLGPTFAGYLPHGAKMFPLELHVGTTHLTQSLARMSRLDDVVLAVLRDYIPVKGA